MTNQKLSLGVFMYDSCSPATKVLTKAINNITCPNDIKDHKKEYKSGVNSFVLSIRDFHKKNYQRLQTLHNICTLL